MIQINKITFFKTITFIKQLKETKPPENILVVGSGNGTEVACLAEYFPTSLVHGIDINAQNVKYKNYVIEPGNAENMRFTNDEFDMIYSYHVLEHVSDPTQVISEIYRVLEKDCKLLIGTPNRKRIVGYFSGDASFWKKIMWNFEDWKAMLQGRFKNEYGAHAGFTHKEMQELLSKKFPVFENVTRKYYEEIYKSKKMMVRLIYALRVNNLILPAIYYVAKK